jgi:putative addiction module antidote
MIRRLFKTGNSIVISLPREVLDELKLIDGDDVMLRLDSVEHCIVIKKVEKPQSSTGVDEEFARQVAEFIQEYRPALDELSE